MRKFLPLIFTGLFLSIIVFLNIAVSTLAQQNNRCTDLEAIKSMQPPELADCIGNLTKAKDQSVAATQGVQRQVSGIKARVAQIENDLAIKQKNIDNGYKNLEKQTEVLNATIRDYYVKSYYNSPFLVLLSAKSASQITQLLAYQQAATNQDKMIITNIALTITALQQQKIDLETEKVDLAAVKVKLDKVVADSLAYQATLSNQISTLSQRQQEILAQRLSSLGIPLYATTTSGCVDDRGKDPGFNPKFAFFSYGVPNRVGLNQYGAYGRANAGQPYDTILHAYYNFDGYQSVDPNSITIKVNDSNGYNSGNIIWSGNLDQYIRRIYEVSKDWPAESLKAQVIAATSYVLAETDNGNKSICANTYCQVFQTGEKGGGWGQAITDLENAEGGKNKIMTKDGKAIIAWFSSTHGGYVHSSGGDVGGASWTKDAVDTPSGSVSSFDDLKNNAYDKDSPWFYCDWGGRGQNNTAFLKPEEVADIVNVALLAQKDSTIGCFVFQTDKTPPPPGKGCSTTDNWSADKVKQKLQDNGIQPFTSVSGISVDVDWGSGKVSTIHVSGNAPDPAFSGSFFKDYFNLRAPANIQIVGPLYNVETN